MPQISGIISGSIKSVALNVPSNVKWFSVYDRGGAGATVKIGIVISGRDIYLENIVLAAGASSSKLVDIKTLAGSQILIVSSAEIFYFFTLEDV